MQMKGFFFFQFLHYTSLLIHALFHLKVSLGKKRACWWRGWIEYVQRARSHPTSHLASEASILAPWRRSRHNLGQSSTKLIPPRAAQARRPGKLRSPSPWFYVWAVVSFCVLVGRRSGWVPGNPSHPHPPASGCWGGGIDRMESHMLAKALPGPLLAAPVPSPFPEITLCFRLVKEMAINWLKVLTFSCSFCLFFFCLHSLMLPDLVLLMPPVKSTTQ